MSDYEKQPTKICSHPDFIICDYKKSQPCVMTRICDCGANQSCSVCGNGQRSIPCLCHPKPPANHIDIKFTLHNEI